MLLVATGLAAYAVKRMVLPLRHEAAPVTSSAPSASALPSAEESPPAPPIASVQLKPKPAPRAHAAATPPITPTPLGTRSPDGAEARPPKEPRPPERTAPMPTNRAPDAIEYPVPKPIGLPEPPDVPPVAN